MIALGLVTIAAVVSPSGFGVHAQSTSSLYYIRTDGNDRCRGTTNAPDALPGSDVCAFRTMKQALSVVSAGDTISILPGIYREPIVPEHSGTEGQPITIKAENGPNTVYFYASESSQGKEWKDYSEYIRSGRSLDLQAGVDINHIRFIDLDWCYTEDERGSNHTFYDDCSHVPTSEIAIPFETDLVALVKYEGTPSRTVIRLPKAKEPDWTVDVPWKHSENWWKADSGAKSLNDGGASPKTTSRRFLKDTMDDPTLDEDLDGKPDFPNIPPGNVKAIFAQNDFTDPREAEAPSPGEASPQYATMPKKSSLGATIIFNDGYFGGYTDNMFIKAYNQVTGIIELQDPRGDADGQDRLQSLTKFYIEGTPKAMDCPGEWVHHDGKLFVLTGTGCGGTVTVDDLQNLEIAKRFQLLKLESVSHIVVQDVNFSFGNTNRFGRDLYRPWNEGIPKHLMEPASLISVSSEPGKNSGAAKHVVFDGITVEHSTTGMEVLGSSRAVPDSPSQLTVRNSTFQHVDSVALRFSNSYPDNSPTSFGVFEPLIIEDNYFRDVGFRPIAGSGSGLHIIKASKVIFRRNLIQNTGHNGVQFHQLYGLFVSDDLLIEGNTFDSTCQLTADCGGLKFHGGAKSYGDVLVMDNVSQNTIGWTYARWRRDLAASNHPTVGDGAWLRYTQLGPYAHGYYLDWASGITFYRNFAINNSSAGIFMNQNYRDGRIHIFHNIIHGSLDGIRLATSEVLQRRFVDHARDHTDTKIIGNVFSKNENAGIYLACSSSDTLRDDDRDANTPNTLGSKNVEIDNNIYQRYDANPNPNPYWWFDEADFAPVDVHYQGCDGQEYNYADVATLRERTPWEDHGLDWDTGAPLYANEKGSSKEDFSLADDRIAAVTMRSAVPADVASLMTLLEAELGVAIQDPSEVEGTAEGSISPTDELPVLTKVSPPATTNVSPPATTKVPPLATTKVSPPATTRSARRPLRRLAIIGAVGVITVGATIGAIAGCMMRSAKSRRW